MRIVTRLYLAVLLPVLLAVVVAAIVWNANRTIDRAMSNEKLAEDTVHGAYELNFLTYDYLQDEIGRERALEQWKQKYAALKEMLSQLDFPGAEESIYLGRARTALFEIGAVFGDLQQAGTGGGGARADSPVQLEYKRRLVDQVVRESQELISVASLLAQSCDQTRQQARQRSYRWMLASVIGTALILAVYAAVLSRRIRRPIARLHAGTEIVGHGDLDYKIGNSVDDELGELSTAFDAMTSRLKVATVSRDALAREVAERKQTQEELARSNEALAMFAYAASHDLQEPLRAVSGCVQLLQQNYQGRLDAQANELIQFAVDGAARMRALINGLLAYSRVETKGQPFVQTDCAKILEDALANLATAITESGAVVTHDPMPTVTLDPSQMLQLLQNLVGNALKFRGERPPAVHIGAQRQEGAWLFSVRDNGIGIDPQYFDRIFTLFQRLHTQAQYPGTGIGLAVCKKIVERHGGRMWVESVPGKGATFFFTVPDRQ